MHFLVELGVALVVVGSKFKYGSVVCRELELEEEGNFYKSPENPCVSSL